MKLFFLSKTSPSAVLRYIPLTPFLLPFCSILVPIVYANSVKGGGFMTDIRDVGQKMHGKLKQFQGEINQRQGGTQGIKGGFQKMKGKLEETIADAKLRSKHKSRQDW